MKKAIFVFLFLIAGSIPCFAQNELLDTSVTPNPANMEAYMGRRDFRSVKQRITIIDYNIRDRNARDTANIADYDDKGRQIKYMLFEGGRRYSITTYDYSTRKNMTLEYMQNISPRYLTFFRTTYDQQGRKISIYHAEVQHNDTTSRGEAKYEYKNGLLIKGQEYLNGKLILTHEYLYKSSDLQQAEVRTGNSPAYYQYIYRYNGDHQPVNESVYHFRPAGVDTLSPYNFIYKDKRLVSESYFSGSYPQKLTNIIFGYDTSGRIISKDEARDTLYRKITFEYTGPYIAKIVSKANTYEILGKDPMMRNVFSLTHMPVIYETDYYYDEKNYLINTVEKLNGVMQFSIRYINTYY